MTAHDHAIKCEERAIALAAVVGANVEIVQHRQSGAHTEDASKALNQPPENIVKFLILEDGKLHRTVGVIIRGDNRLDQSRLKNATGLRHLRFASADRVRALTSFEIGGVPPFALSMCDYRFACETLFERPRLVGAGGHEYAGMIFAPNDLRLIEGVRIALISK